MYVARCKKTLSPCTLIVLRNPILVLCYVVRCSPQQYTTCICYVQLLLRFFAIIVTASAANYWVLIPAVIVIVVFIVIRWYYLKTSRDVKRLEAIGELQLCMSLRGIWISWKLCHCICPWAVFHR